MNRRSFLSGFVAAASGLLLPVEPRRVYSFASALRTPGIADMLIWVPQNGFRMIEQCTFPLEKLREMSAAVLANPGANIRFGFMRVKEAPPASEMRKLREKSAELESNSERFAEMMSREFGSIGAPYGRERRRLVHVAGLRLSDV